MPTLFSKESVSPSPIITGDSHLAEMLTSHIIQRVIAKRSSETLQWIERRMDSRDPLYPIEILCEEDDLPIGGAWQYWSELVSREGLSKQVFIRILYMGPSLRPSYKRLSKRI